jgi:hypothetical protein
MNGLSTLAILAHTPHEFIYSTQGIEISSSIKLLLAEYIRYLVDKAVYYNSTMLPEDMLEAQPNLRELDKSLRSDCQ